MSIEVYNESGIAVDESLIASVARYALDAMRVSPAAELCVTAVTLDAMSELHERWMDEPGPTDVMASRWTSWPRSPAARTPPTSGPALLGDVVLCPEFAKDPGPDGRAHAGRRAAPAHRARRAAPARLRPRRARAGAGDVRAAEPAARRVAGGREQAAAREAQRRSDSAVLGAAGLEDG